MECKEWAAEALHTVAETAQENAHKLGVRGLKPLISLADEGSHMQPKRTPRRPWL